MYIDQKHPFLGITIFLVISGLVVGFALAASDLLYPVTEHLDSDKSAMDQQIEELEQVEVSLFRLIVFTQRQQKTLTATQKLIDELEAEKAQLEPIVKANREVINELFRLQEQRQQREKWIDRIIGFVAGLVTEILVAVWIAPGFVWVFKKREKKFVAAELRRQ